MITALSRSRRQSVQNEENMPDQEGQKPKRRANELSGAEWTKNSISVWSDIRKDAHELQLKHPAMFPNQLVSRLIQCFMSSSDHVLLDPFMGSGGALLAARNLGKHGIGFELNPEYVELARSRFAQQSLFGGDEPDIYNADAKHILKHIAPDSVDFAVTSPPYWDVLSQKRTADSKEIRDYGDLAADLGRVQSYESFLDELSEVFEQVYEALKIGKYFVVNVMDLRKKDRYYPYHSDVAARMEKIGFTLDDIIIWDRRQEYNFLRPLGYPAVFRLNKVHEYLMIFQKRS